MHILRRFPPQHGYICLNVPSHFRRQCHSASWDEAASIAATNWHWGQWVVVFSDPIVLGYVTDTGSPSRADRHIIGVAVGVDDGGDIKAASGIVKVGLSPSGIRGAGGSFCASSLGPANLRIVLEGNGLLAARCEGEAERWGCECKAGSKVGFNSRRTRRGLVPDNNGDGNTLSVLESVREVVPLDGIYYHHVGAFGVSNVSDLVNVAT